MKFGFLLFFFPKKSYDISNFCSTFENSALQTCLVFMFVDKVVEMKEVQNDVRTVLNTPQVRLRVCETCSAQLSIMEHETRLADHYGGKMHLGMEKIREICEEMKVGFENFIFLIF